MAKSSLSLARNKASSSTEPSLGSCYNIQMCDEELARSRDCAEKGEL